MLRWLAAVVVLGSMLVACADEDLEPTPASTSVTATASVEAATTSTPETPTPGPTFEAFRTGLWLIDVTSSRANVHVLSEGEAYPLVPSGGWRDGNEVWVYFVDGNHSVRFDLSGAEVESVAGYQLVQPDCELIDAVEPRIAIDGRQFEGVSCGNVSPDRSHMLFGRSGDSPNVSGGTYDAWILDLDSGEQWLVTDQLRHCGGCDGRAGPAWSPSGAFLTVGETYAGDDSTVYLVDVQIREVTPVAAGGWANSVPQQPAWAPDRDLLLVPNEEGEATILDAWSGNRLNFDGSTWPAWWIAGGTYVYWLAGDSTTIADAATGERLVSWAGHPSKLFWQGRVSIEEAVGGPAALLATPTGTWVHHPALEAPRFIEAADGGTWSPDAARAAVAVRVLTSGYDQQRCDIVVVEADGHSTTVATGARSNSSAPEMWWNEAGTHFLIRFPGGEWP